MRLVGINAQAGSGKSTLAESLAKMHNFAIISLADPFKRFAQEVYGFTRDQLWGPSDMRNAPDKRYPRPCTVCLGAGREERLHLSSPPCFVCNGDGVTYLTPREALQKIGTEWGRYNYLNTWVNMLFRDVTQLESGGCYYEPWTGVHRRDSSTLARYAGYIVPDLRHLNEITAVRDHGGRLVRLKGSFVPIPAQFGQHASEQDQLEIPDDMFDIVFDKTDTPEQRFKGTTDLLGL
jgi:hypothetical protein